MERKNWLIVISLACNGILLWLLLVVWASGAIEGRVLISPNIVACAQGPLYFARAAEGSELREMMPHAIFVVQSGLVRSVMEFADESLTSCTEITIHDRLGRAWVSLDLKDGTMIHERYADDSQSEPQISVRDTDGDGIPNTMVNWELKKGFEVDQKLTWRPAVPRESRP